MIPMKPDTRNPLVRLRLEAGLTQVQLAEATNLSRQVIIRLEQAQFPEPLEPVLDYFYGEGWLDSYEGLLEEYFEFQRDVRTSVGAVLLEPAYPCRAYLGYLGGLTSEATHPMHPFKFWRSVSPKYPSVSRVAKSLCVHQGLLYKYEDEPHLVNTTPGQLVEALTVAGYPSKSLDELQLCYNEFKGFHHQLALVPLLSVLEGASTDEPL